MFRFRIVAYADSRKLTDASKQLLNVQNPQVALASYLCSEGCSIANAGILAILASGLWGISGAMLLRMPVTYAEEIALGSPADADRLGIRVETRLDKDTPETSRKSQAHD